MTDLSCETINMKNREDVMETYHVDSPEALWRLITIMGLSDGCFSKEDELPSYSPKWCFGT